MLRERFESEELFDYLRIRSSSRKAPEPCFETVSKPRPPELAAWYPSAGGTADPAAGSPHAWAALRRTLADERDTIRHWLEREYPKIARRAKRQKAFIYWGDETGVSNQDQVGRGYAPKGQTPVVRRTAKKISTSMISAVNNVG